MRLLVDSHVLIWTIDTPERLGRSAHSILRDDANEVFLSTASLWELSIKQSAGRLRIDGDLRAHARLAGFTELPVSGEHAGAVRDLPYHHRDPFDRMLVAQAHVEELTLVTSDRELGAYGVPILPATD